MESGIIITKVEANLGGRGGMIAYVNIIISHEFIIRGLRVIKTRDGRRIVYMPSRERISGDYKEIAHPLTGPCREKIEKAVFEEIDKLEKQNDTVIKTGT